MTILVPLLIIQLSFNNAIIAANSSHTGVFNVGQSQYILDGQTAAMDVAPVINDGRTLVPVRYLAYALGLTADDIGWDVYILVHPGLAVLGCQNNATSNNCDECLIAVSNP